MNEWKRGRVLSYNVAHGRPSEGQYGGENMCVRERERDVRWGALEEEA